MHKCMLGLAYLSALSFPVFLSAQRKDTSQALRDHLLKITQALVDALPRRKFNDLRLVRRL